MSKSDIVQCKSVTHVHLLAAVRAELERLPRSTRIRVLDVGCGNGALIGYLHRCLTVLEPGVQVELFGFDVSDPGVQKPSFLHAAIHDLRVLDPAVNWEARLLSVTAHDPWPFESGSFDMVISNQVLEHVADHTRFFSELNRVLRPGGVSLHCFPVKECMWEGHIHLPWVHWVAGHHGRTALIRWFSQLGLGKFREHRRKTGISLEDFASRHADFVNLYTNYVSARELLRVLKACRLRASFAYSGGLFLHKLCSLFGRTYRLEYRSATAGLGPATAFWFLKRLSSITLRVEKVDAYRHHYM